ncbi:hypothetical protein [Anabaena sp. UHCC 0399]|uniref:hypothetical protein n=1 Tax=Anabaena sp. UHCC 0399 TaxID=3110238 RepID=UPI002B21A8CE|nr:hypothetical protein [Anabaena sp. UHCC 0399]MEA5564212.1 hypothetical protein [Anabaena sp. UHCC 0399]
MQDSLSFESEFPEHNCNYGAWKAIASQYGYAKYVSNNIYSHCDRFARNDLHQSLLVAKVP